MVGLEAHLAEKSGRLFETGRKKLARNTIEPHYVASPLRGFIVECLHGRSNENHTLVGAGDELVVENKHLPSVTRRSCRVCTLRLRRPEICWKNDFCATRTMFCADPVVLKVCVTVGPLGVCGMNDLAKLDHRKPPFLSIICACC